MSDSEEALLALNLVVENCRAALGALIDDTHDIDNDDHPTVDFAILRTDFLSILSLLYTASTKVALSLKPSALEHHRAAIVPLKDLSNNVAALTHSVRLIRQSQGQTLLAEYKGTAQDTIRSLEYFANGLHSSISQSHEDDNYLVAVNKVHELIDNAKRPGALSLDNKAAVRKRWLQDHDSLLDGAEEIQEMANPTDEESFCDGWEDLGLSAKQDLSPEEKARLETLRPLIKLSNLLHKRILNDLLSQNSRNLGNNILDHLSTHSSKLLVASDNLITSMYSPQQSSVVTLHLSDYLNVLTSLQHVLLPQQDLDQQLAALSMSGPSGDKILRWFTICFDQIEKAARTFSRNLEENVQTQVC